MDGGRSTTGQRDAAGDGPGEEPTEADRSSTPTPSGSTRLAPDPSVAGDSHAEPLDGGFGGDGPATRPLSWKAVARRAVAVVVAGVAVYLVLPSISRVLGSWPRLGSLNLIWFAVAVAAEAAHFSCTFALQRLALRTRAWFPVVTAQLAGNAITLVMPGGAAAGAAVQFRMLGEADMDAATAAGGLTAFSLLGVAGLFALPILAMPAILFGAPVDHGLVEAAVVGTVGFAFFAVLGVVVIATNRPLCWFGRVAARARNAVLRRRPPISGLDQKFLDQRDDIRAVLGSHWVAATLLSTGRLGLDYLCLLGCLRATGCHPSPSLVLLAFAVAGVIGMFPVTPGGLGVVEASLSGLLVLAGVGSGSAVLATLGYRICSYWLPMLAGPVAYAAFRRRYGRRRGRATSAEAAAM